MIFHGEFYSKYLEVNTRLTITGADPDPKKPYKILYLLHPVCCNSDTWSYYTRLPLYIRNYNVLCVTPEVNRSFYADQKYGQKYFAYVGKELPNFLERMFKFSSKREDTSVMGVSMGGYGALRLALTYPERFGFCAFAASPMLFLKADIEQFKAMSYDEKVALTGPQFIEDLKAMFGPDLDAGEEYEIMRLMEKTPCGCKPEIFHCCGTEDYLYHQNKVFSEQMQQWGAFKYTYREWKGGHKWAFFDEFLRQALEYRYDNEESRSSMRVI